MKRDGPSIDPCGIPSIYRPVMSSLPRQRLSGSFRRGNFWSSCVPYPGCHTGVSCGRGGCSWLSKGLAKSMMSTSVWRPSWRFLVRSSINSITCGSQDLFLRKTCCSWYRMPLSSPCRIMLLANTCSIILQQTEVGETGW